MSATDLKLVGFRVPAEIKEDLQKEAENAGFSTVASYLRSAWRLAKARPDLLSQIEAEELDYQQNRPMSCYHPMARRE